MAKPRFHHLRLWIAIALVTTAMSSSIPRLHQRENRGPAAGLMDDCESYLRMVLGIGPYSSNDFPGSAFWSGQTKHNPQFSKWAAENANRTLALFKDGLDPSYVLNEVAISRAKLADELDAEYKGATEDNPFGAYRSTDEQETSYFSLTNESEFLPSAKEVIAMVRAKAQAEYITLSSSPSSLAPNTYQPVSGALVESTRIWITFQLIALEHPFGKAQTDIFSDVMSRIVKLQNKKATNAPSIQEFAAIMYGYYNAVPFKRGSSAIGRAFFAGLYAYVFEKPIPALPDGTDLRAMILDQDEFVEIYSKLLK
jgi:hypothetical protein